MYNRISGKACRDIYNPLVAASPVGESSVFEFLYKSSVDDHLAQGQQLPFRRTGGSRQLLVRITGIDPDREARQLGAELMDEVSRSLCREKRVPACQRQAVQQRIVCYLGDNLAPALRSEDLSIIEVPGLRVEASGAAVAASAEEEDRPQSLSFIDRLRIISADVHRCLTRSRTSACLAALKRV